ncbi:MAG TPA: hypothetical protein ENK57_01855 [Polyangiaceae bacterium]|nr:hypothetical protein [Polyangiaceae bacterium]
MTTRSFLRRHRWWLALTALGLAVRLVWVHYIHPPEEAIWSDMAAYVGRAERLVSDPLGPHADEAFYPFGTHYLLAIPMALFGPKAYDACATWWALLGAAVVPIAYLLCGRLLGGASWLSDAHDADEPDDDLDAANAAARAAGLLVAVDYPLFSYTGLFLSEVPFTLLLTATALFGLRFVDEGRRVDAWGFGTCAALGAAVRPQLLVGLALAVAIIVLRRKHFEKVSLARLGVGLIPVVAIVAFSLAQSHHHTGRATILAQNGALNRAFGRCHAYEIIGQGGGFGPPAFGTLWRAGQADPAAWPKLDPAKAPKLFVPAPMWDEEAMNALADECVQRTGLGRQATYAMTHVGLLWGFNVAWPFSEVEPHRSYMRGWMRAHLLFVPGMIVAMAMGASRRWPRHGVVTAFLWSLILVAMLVMGSARFRVPYDALIIVAALDVYARLQRWWQRR